jgi:site-specific recombinase XerD
MIRLSLEAQSLFGLRREESIKLILSEAWIGDSLKIKPSWTKGGIGRTLPITSNEQRQWLIKANQQVPAGQSLIPKERTYKQHLSHYQVQAKAMGVCKLHGLRHAYAQRRYHELTKQLDPHGKGFICPISGGTPTKLLTNDEKMIDRKAREILSRLLGHSRVAITKIYLS